MKKSVYWTSEQSAVLQAIFDKASSGTKVVYIPGNHDDLFRNFVGSNIKGVAIQHNAVHTTRQNQRFFVSHGDEFDGVIKHNRFMLLIGDSFYQLLLKIDRTTNRVRRYFQLPYWSASAFIKSQVGQANRYIDKFENAALHAARSRKFDGYICGHIHKAGIKKIDNTVYCNDGDWVENCTALVENTQGTLQLLHWSDRKHVTAVQNDTHILQTDLPLAVAASMREQTADRDRAA